MPVVIPIITAVATVGTAVYTSIKQGDAQAKAARAATDRAAAENAAFERAEEVRIEAEEKQRITDEKFALSTTQGRQIETLTNLITAKESLQSQIVPMIMTTPSASPVKIGFVESINNMIHSWFNF